jgi:hypothetical protein
VLDLDPDFAEVADDTADVDLLLVVVPVVLVTTVPLAAN